jgi:hypothetical protein
MGTLKGYNSVKFLQMGSYDAIARTFLPFFGNLWLRTQTSFAAGGGPDQSR